MNTQDWTPGAIVRVGFVALRVVCKAADYWVLESPHGARKVYHFTPYNGLERIE